MKKIAPLVIVVCVLVAALVGFGTWWYLTDVLPESMVSNNAPINTNTNTETWVNPKADLITVDNLKPNDTISSPLKISGQARGTWFFEASFPIYLVDSHETQLAVAVAQAQGEWMTENFVPYEAVLNFNASADMSGFIVLKKDNPSGLPEHDDELRIPVMIKAGTKTTVACVITGCSSQLCADHEMITTCEYLPEYACYKDAKCELQANGECGWTQSSTLAACLTANKNP